MVDLRAINVKWFKFRIHISVSDRNLIVSCILSLTRPSVSPGLFLYMAGKKSKGEDI